MPFCIANCWYWFLRFVGTFVSTSRTSTNFDFNTSVKVNLSSWTFDIITWMMKPFKWHSTLLPIEILSVEGITAMLLLLWRQKPFTNQKHFFFKYKILENILTKMHRFMCCCWFNLLLATMHTKWLYKAYRSNIDRVKNTSFLSSFIVSFSFFKEKRRRNNNRVTKTRHRSCTSSIYIHIYKVVLRTWYKHTAL